MRQRRFSSWALLLFPTIVRPSPEMPAGMRLGKRETSTWRVKRLAISRALMSRPTLLLLDEPSLGLAPQVTQTIFRILREVNAQGVSILLVEQNAHLALGLCHWAYVLETGEMAMTGTGADLLASEAIRKAYLGE